MTAKGRFSRCFRCLASAGIALVIASCSQDEPPPPTVPAVSTFSLTAPGERPFRSFPGELAATSTASLSFDVPGRIIELPAEPGQFFSEGDLLARLDPETFEAQVSAATAQLEAARRELERRKGLREQGAVSQSELDQAQRLFDVAEADLRTARQRLADSVMRAPFDGRVGQRLISNFQTVQPTQVVLVFVDVSSMEVQIDVPEQDFTLARRGVTIEEVDAGIEALLTFSNLPGRSFPLRLKSFGTRASPGSRTFPVVFMFDPPDEVNLLPGMTCTVMVRSLVDEEAPLGAGVYEVPASAVVESDGVSGLWRVCPESSEVSLVPVEMLGMADEFIRVRGEDLKPGDIFVRAGTRFLSEGRKVRPLPQD